MAMAMDLAMDLAMAMAMDLAINKKPLSYINLYETN
jgi:hypothetical protein